MATTALTPEVAQELMWRSMTTGVPTNEFTQYGGYDAVKAAYDQLGGVYGFEAIPAAKQQEYAQQIAQTGVGNLSLLAETGVPLSASALASYAANPLVSQYLNPTFFAQRGIPTAGATGGAKVVGGTATPGLTGTAAAGMGGAPLAPPAISSGVVPRMPGAYISPAPIQMGGNRLGPSYETPPTDVSPLALPQLNLRNLINQGVVPPYVAAPQSTADFMYTPVVTIGNRIF